VCLFDNAVYEARPDLLFVAPCGFGVSRTEQYLPLLQYLPGWADLPCVRDGRVYYTEGNAYFSRAGPRLVESLEVLAHSLHPDVHPISVCGEVAKTWQNSS
jgi:iron complex transport system substrate-binding protein